MSFLVSFQTPAFISALAFASGLTTKQEEAIFGYIMLCLNNSDPTINLPSKMGKKALLKRSFFCTGEDIKGTTNSCAEVRQNIKS